MTEGCKTNDTPRIALEQGGPGVALLGFGTGFGQRFYRLDWFGIVCQKKPLLTGRLSLAKGLVADFEAAESFGLWLPEGLETWDLLEQQSPPVGWPLSLECRMVEWEIRFGGLQVWGEVETVRSAGQVLAVESVINISQQGLATRLPGLCDTWPAGSNR